MLHVALDRLDQVRDEFGAPCELHVDAGVRLVDEHSLLAESVHPDDRHQAEGHDDHQDDDEDDGHVSLPVGSNSLRVRLTTSRPRLPHRRFRR